ncbi:MAG: carbohydrate kinase family protein [Patescibacteria group bacterium]
MNEEKNIEDIDVLAIGDTVIDYFIKLKDASVSCDIDSENCKLCVSFGEKIPYESVTKVSGVGNSPNAAVAAARLGLKSALIVNVGKDQYGQDCLDVFKKEKIITDYIQVQENKKTNEHYVLLYEAERTILIKHEKFDYQISNDIPNVKWVYLSSMAENSLDFYPKIIEWLKERPETKLAFQPGTFQIKFGLENLKDIYERTNIFLCNKGEAEIILGIEKSDIKVLFQKMHALGPRIVIISDGPNGAYASDQNNIYFLPMYPDIAPPVDRTGAGDAFSSTLVSALILGKTLPEAMAWGGINSMSVVQYIGAQQGLLSQEKIQEYLALAPENYQVKKI